MVVKCTSGSLKSPLLLGTLICSFLGTACEETRNPPSQVNGILGGSASFSMKLSSEKTLSKLEWTFQNKFGRKLNLAEFRNGTWKWSKARDWFGQRLEIAEIANIATLRIKDLKMEDSGEYEAVMTHSTAETQFYMFNLTVYEPVPEPKPQIIPPHPQQATEGCNVTLQCQEPGKGGFSVSWKKGNPLSNLNKSSDWYQLSTNGRDLHVLWWPNSSDSTFTCLVSNAVDQKSTSFNLSSICPNEGNRSGKMWWRPYLVMPVFIVVAGSALWIWKKRRERSDNRAAVLTMPENKSNSEPQYAEISERRRSRPAEGGRHQELDRSSDQSCTMNPSAAYAMLQIPNHLSELVT